MRAIVGLWAVWLGGCQAPPVDSAPGRDDSAPSPPTEATITGPLALREARAEVYDPYPSILRVSWMQSAPARVQITYAFEGETRTTPARELLPGAQAELLLGVPYDSAVTWTLEAVGEEDGKEVVRRTEPAVTRNGGWPPELPRPVLVDARPDRFDPELEYLLVSVSLDQSFVGEYVVVLLDRQARVLWHHRTPRRRAAMHPRLAHDGRSLLIDQTSHWGGEFDGGASSEVLQIGIGGTVLKTWTTPGLYHAFTDLPDGSLAWPVHWAMDRDGELGPDGERLILQRRDGTEREVFDCVAALVRRCQANTLAYDAARDTFLYSLFTVESVLEVDASTGDLLRVFGQLDGAWSFDPPESAFWYQHGSVYTDEGTLLVSTHRAEDDEELVVREYEVDEEARTLRQVWSFGEGEGVTGAQMGEAHRLRGGHTLHNYGTHAVLREVTDAGEVVWDVRWETQEYGRSPGYSIGRSTPIYDADLYRLLHRPR